MALEAWVILRATGAAISPNGALAVETFSRVASFASAFIPANLGALEASSLAAVAAVGAAGGGAALALARRLRGLFWAGIGLAIYPRRVKSVPAGESLRHQHEEPPPPRTLLYLPHDPFVSVPFFARLAGLPLAERVLRAARRAGYTRVVVWLPDGDSTFALTRLIRRLAPSLDEIVVATREEDWRELIEHLPATEQVTVVGAGTVASTALLEEAGDSGGRRPAR